jgi:D-xylose transport system substrate-binding protein
MLHFSSLLLKELVLLGRAVLLAGALFFPFLSCGKAPPSPEAKAATAPERQAESASGDTGNMPGTLPVQAARDGSRQDGKPVIGFSVATDTFIIERWNKDMRVFAGAAQELGAEVITQLSAGGTREQISQINYMINQNIDVLVVIANDTEELAGAARQVRDAGIPVIAYDRLIMGAPLDAYVSFDSREVGRLFARACLAEAPRGRYLIVNGSLHDTNSFQISEGVHEILDQHAGQGGVEIVDEFWLEEWSYDEALSRIGAVFREAEASSGGIKLDAIICGNDAIASAAVQLLSERRLAGEVVVVGQDAELIACQHIVEGIQLMTAYKPIGALATEAARIAVARATGRSLPEPDMMLDNGSGQSVPAYIEKPVAIYKDNMDIVIRDGFHSREDIYRNAQLP